MQRGLGISRSERDQEEIKRSAIEAARITLEPVSVGRYLNPNSEAAYPLEFAYHLLGEVKGKLVLDLGCGTGENLIVLANRGADVVGIDISPALIRLAQRRLDNAGETASLKVATAYNTGLLNESVDVVFAIAVLHHLELAVVREEIRRILRKDGLFILSEPIRFSKTLNQLRTLLPVRGEISPYEHPLNRAELAEISQGFAIFAERNFRLPFVPLLGEQNKRLWRADRWMNRQFPKLEHYATIKVMSLKRLY